VENRPLPEVEVVDMRNERGEGGNIPMLSRALEDAIRDTLNRGKQVLLFLNRRGFDTFLCCLDCGHVFKCANCSVAMTHHMSDGTLRCHYCGYSVKALPICPTCGGSRVRSYGVGTEKLKEKIELLFPEAVIERMDSDSTSEKGAYERILRSVHEGKIDVLVGTQMITKGHDFPNVTLIGVISADTSLNAPDFRAAEKTFQILTQVSGRGGRGDTPGNVIIQTLNPDHYAIRRAKEHDYTGFYGDEIPLRKELGYPPFGRMVNFRISGTNRDKTADFSVMLGNIARRFSESKNIKHKIDVMGPVEAPIARIKGRFRWQMILKGRESRALHVLTENILKAAGKTDLDIKVDVDPLNFM
jgi:primosomal protein N' (replication factor Y)